MNEFYVYVLFRDEECLQPFYVGKGKGDRIRDHEKRRKRDRNPYKKHVVAICIDKFGYVPSRVLHQNLNETDAFRLEKHWISYWGRKLLGTGCLTNMTDGGEGVSGYIYTPEQRAASSALRKGVPRGPHAPETIEKMRLAHLGKPKSAEHKLKLSEANMGKIQTPEQKIKNREWHLGRPRSPETVEKSRLGLKRHVRTVEHGLAISAAKKGHKQAPEIIARQVASRALTMAGRPGPNTGRVFSAEVREKMRQSQIARHARKRCDG